MKHLCKAAGALVALGILAGFTSEQSGGKDNRKQVVNLSGTLVTQIGHKEYKVENISIAGMISDIRLFQLPDSPTGALSYDPHAGIEFKVKLEKGVIIEVPAPKKVWSYKRNERASKIEYIAIEFTPCDKGKKQEYIVETSRPLLCEEFGGACKSTPMRTPLSQIERLIIEDSKPWEEVRSCPIKSKKEKNKVATSSVSRSARSIEDAQKEQSREDKDHKSPVVLKEDSQK